jgi:membrane protein YdbS with pleckstrin-like domain
LFSDGSVELVIRNITHVTLVKPFIASKLFGVGTVLIELAGSASVEGFLFYVDKPEFIYDSVKEIMQKNGFKLTKQNLIQKEKPSLLGVFMEIGGGILAILFFSLYFIGPLIMVVGSIFGVGGILGALLVVIVIVLFVLFLRVMNLLSRTYYIYGDAIVYEEGFLTKVNSFMPVENLADSAITQNLFEKIFDLYDVKISCQGASHEILFKNLKKGQEMERNIDELIKNMKPLVGTYKEKVNPEIAAMKIPSGKIESINFDESFTHETKMEFGRSAAGLMIGLVTIFIVLTVIGLITGLALVLIPLGIGIGVFGLFVGGLGIGIAVSSTKFDILEKGISEKFDFLNKRNIEFSNDKITGVVFKKNFIDNWFGTFSTIFWSIGSGANINFKNIKYSAEVKNGIMAKLGIAPEEEIYKINSAVTLGALLKANIGLCIVALLIIVGSSFLAISNIVFIAIPILIVIIGIILIVYKKAFYSTSSLTFTKNYVYFKAGIFFINEYYALYNNIKDITTVKYPFSKYGTITFNVAGETTIQTAQSNNKMSLLSMMGGNRNLPTSTQLIPHAFSINYSEDIDSKDELIDIIFYKRPNKANIASFEAEIQSYKTKNILAKKPSISNSIFGIGIVLGVIAIIISLVVGLSPVALMVWVGYVIIIGLIIWKTKVQCFTIQPYRVLSNSGILYKKQTSIIFNKIDHLRNYQGFTNKIFGTGSITIHTTGSSLPEIMITNIKDYKEFYKTLEQFYQ